MAQSDDVAISNDGKERIFLVVVDDSAEMKVALHFASRRAKRSGGRVALLHVQEPADFQHWVSVGEIMREENREAAEELLQKLSAEVADWSGRVPTYFLREGDRREELAKLLAEEPTISVVVLAANVSGGGPGPLISYMLDNSASQLHVPITIVPGSLSDEDILGLT
ncbi:MAG: universal stress protein [Alphaproteobacteria bacterium]|nr:universal stress protein [Alphaproteobacteria bacterium]